MSANTKPVTDDTFATDVLKADRPVLVDFWAEWCGPCKMIAPILEQIADEQAGRMTLSKLDVDQNMETARRFEVMSIPTLILFKDGEPVHRLVGAKSKAQLEKELETFL